MKFKTATPAPSCLLHPVPYALPSCCDDSGPNVNRIWEFPTVSPPVELAPCMLGSMVFRTEATGDFAGGELNGGIFLGL